MTGEGQPWYSGKELLEMSLRLENKLTEVTHELKVTQAKMDKYNNLVEKFQKAEDRIHECENKIIAMETAEDVRDKHLKSIRAWVVFGITVISALTAWGVFS
jgi:uncharacterized protein YydD (DUF2326 family)